MRFVLGLIAGLLIAYPAYKAGRTAMFDETVHALRYSDRVVMRNVVVLPDRGVFVSPQPQNMCDLCHGARLVPVRQLY